MGSYGNNGKINLEELNENLKKNIEGLTYQGNSISDTNKIKNLPEIVIVDGYKVKIWESGDVTLEGENSQKPPVYEVAVPGEKVEGEKNKIYTKNGTAVIPVGFVIVPGLDDVEEGLVISDNIEDTEENINAKVAKGNQFVWIPVTDETKYERNTTYYDINVSTSSNDDTGYLPEGIINEEQAVRNVKGFYISRYEAGKEGTKLVSKKEANVWDNISQEEAKSAAKTMFQDNNHVKSALLSGTQWDMTMSFITRTPLRKDGLGINDYDVTKDDSSRHIGDNVAKAGNNEADKVCNIYDLEGNAWEFVAEKNTYERNLPVNGRGGFYINFDGRGASARLDDTGNAQTAASFRLVLYVI